jgi:glutaredoxin
MNFLILSKEDCGWCDKAKALINECGGSWVSVDYKDSPVIKPLMKLSYLKTVPQVWAETMVGTEFVGTYEDLVVWLQRE